MSLESRLMRAERNVRILMACMVAILVGLGAVAAAPQGQDTLTVRELHITSPDAQSTLTLSANGTATGLWINDNKDKHPALALYSDGQNSVIGTADKTGNLDCAIATTPKGGVVQMHGENNKPVNITASAWKPAAGAQAEEFNIRFVPSYNSTATGTRLRRQPGE